MLLLMAFGACKKKQAGSPAADGELAVTAEPTGVTWKRISMPFGSLELPIDPGWNLVGTDVQGPGDIVIMLQSQDGITVAQLDEYLAQYGEFRQRESPKYAASATVKGKVSGAAAVRVEGAFDDGTKFVTRDYLVFGDREVVVLSAHAPEAEAARLTGVVDHAARTLQLGAAK